MPVHLITLIMSTVIDADRERVWRALTDPAELAGWDDHIVGSVARTGGGREGSGRRAEGSSCSIVEQRRWRYQLGSVQVVLHERPLEVARLERLSSALKIGSLRIEQTYTLTSESVDPPRTRLGMKLATTSSVPVVGDVVDRFSVRRLAAERIDRTLRSVQSWCQQHP